MASPNTDRSRLKRIIQMLKREHPDAKLDLDFDSPLQLLIALILAAQCTDERVNQVTRALFSRYPTPGHYATESLENLEEAIRSTGFYRQKAKTVRECCRQLDDRFHGEVPSDLDALLTLPGVGRKTANILLGNAFGTPAIGVDTHVGRLAQRLGLSQQRNPDKIEADLNGLVPKAQRVRFAHLLQYHGRRICLSRKPKCSSCVLIKVCPYPGTSGD